jgi:hypothetical protein
MLGSPKPTRILDVNGEQDSFNSPLPMPKMKHRWKSELFSFGPRGAQLRWQRNASFPASDKSEFNEELGDHEERAISQLSKWKSERLQCRLVNTLGIFVKQSADPSDVFIENNKQRFLSTPEYAGRSRAVQSALTVIDDLIHCVFAKCAANENGHWEEHHDAIPDSERPGTARIRRDEVIATPLAAGHSNHTKPPPTRCGSSLCRATSCSPGKTGSLRSPWQAGPAIFR